LIVNSGATSTAVSNDFGAEGDAAALTKLVSTDGDVSLTGTDPKAEAGDGPGWGANAVAQQHYSGTLIDTTSGTVGGATAHLIVSGVHYLTVAANGLLSKIYGSADPAPLTYGVTSGSLLGSDHFTGSIGRAAGENVGDYAINYSGLTAPVSSSYSNYRVTYTPVNFTIDTYHLHVKADAQTKIYGEADPAPLTYHLLDGTTLQFMTDSFSGAQERIAGEDATAYAINRGTLSAGDNYTIDYSGEYLTITPKALTASLIGTVEKEYNGTTDAALVDGNYSLTGIIHSDDVTMSHPTAGTYDTKNVGINKEVTVHGLTLSGAKAGNYSLLSDLSGLVGKITAKALLLSGVIAQNKIYDGNADATLTGGTLGGVISFTTPGTPDFIMPGMSIPDGMGGFIDMPDMIIHGTPDIVTTEQVSLVSGTGTFDNRHVGTDKAVTAVGYGLTGDDAGNYSLSQPTGLSADITKRDLIINAQTDTKFYNGNRDSVALATVEGLTATTGLIAGDILTVGAETFDSKNAGARTLSVSGFTLTDGNDGLNYHVVLNTAAGIINQALLSLSHVYADNKVYNGNTNADIHATLDGVVGTEDVHLTALGAAFDDKNVADDKHVHFTSIGISGANNLPDGLSNYNYSAVFDWINPSHEILADITPKALTISAVTDSKEYDGTTSSLGAPTYDGLVEGIDSLTGLHQLFNSPNVMGTDGSTLSVVDDYNLNDGNNGHNYKVTLDTAKGTISQRDLEITADSDTKVYGEEYSFNGTEFSQTGLLTDFDSISSVDLTSDGAPVTAGVQGGVPYDIIADDAAGTGLGNYHISYHNGGLTVNPKGLYLTDVTAHNKVYDSYTYAEITGGLDGVINEDEVAISSISGYFDDKNVGEDKEVSYSNTNLTGEDAGNYFTYAPEAYLSADITPAPLTITAVEDYKTYDGTTDSDEEPEVFTSEGDGEEEPEVVGLLGDDADGYIDGLSQRFDSKNAGDRKLDVIETALIESDDEYEYDDESDVRRTGFTIYDYDDEDVTGNYDITYLQADGHINKASLHLRGVSAEDKTYDGTTVAQLDTSEAELSGIISVYHESYGESEGYSTTDDVSFVGGTGEFDSKNVGYDKRVRASGFTLAGIDAENYELCQPSRLRADITPKGLTVTANDDRKTFNGLEYAGHDDDGGNGDGNGVIYDGFVAGEDETVLTGELNYGGDSQGAVQIGKYDITVGGYDSAQYHEGEGEGDGYYTYGYEDRKRDYYDGEGGYDGEGFDPNYNYFITYVDGILNINSNSNPTFRTGGLNRPFSSIANNEIELDESFEPIETGHRDIDLGSDRSNADRLANLEPAAGGSPDAEDLADIEPAAGGDTGVGGGTPSGDIACANAFLSDKPCTEQ
jgi:hypothetical protein